MKLVKRFVGLVLLLSALIAVPAFAYEKKTFCKRTYIEDCLQTEYCMYYDGERFTGSVFVQYQCP